MTVGVSRITLVPNYASWAVFSLYYVALRMMNEVCGIGFAPKSSSIDSGALSAGNRGTRLNFAGLSTYTAQLSEGHEIFCLLPGYIRVYSSLAQTSRFHSSRLLDSMCLLRL